MKKLGLLLLYVLIIHGCASKESLRTSSTTETVCSEKSTDNVYKFLVKNMKIHYLGSELKDKDTIHGTYDGSPLSGLSGTTFIQNNKLDDNKYEIILSMKAGITHRMFGELISISKGTNSCNTKINLRYMNTAWKNLHGKYVKDLLNDSSL